MIVENIVRSLF